MWLYIKKRKVESACWFFCNINVAVCSFIGIRLRYICFVELGCCHILCYGCITTSPFIWLVLQGGELSLHSLIHFPPPRPVDIPGFEMPDLEVLKEWAHQALSSTFFFFWSTIRNDFLLLLTEIGTGDGYGVFFLQRRESIGDAWDVEKNFIGGVTFLFMVNERSTIRNRFYGDFF
jgi:hypothetical protein